MAYIKNTWTDQNVERPRTYDMQNNSDGSVTLIDSFGMVTDLGTPVNADNMNHIENGISNVGIWQYDSSVVYAKDDAVISVVDNKFVLYKSLKDQNLNNPLSDKTSWEEVNLGGGSGLELCDIGMALYVDETKGLRRRLNGSIMDITSNYQAFLTRLKEITTLYPSLVCTEEEWQTTKTMSKLGQCGKFVYNYGADGTTVTSIRLPLVININGLVDMANAGLIKDESLPNVSHTHFTVNTSGTSSGGNGSNLTSSLSIARTGITDGWHESYSLQGTSVVPTLAPTSNNSAISSTYKDNAPVQQEAIQYPYFIQIATGSETEANIVNTLENVNGFTLLESKYSDKPLYNESWLLSNGQWNAKAVYPTAYEGLQVEYNTEIEAGTTVTLPSGVSYTKRGLSVKLSTETYTDYDFRLNTADETFMLPLKTKQKFYDEVAPVVGNGSVIGLNGLGNNSTGTISGISGNYLLYNTNGSGDAGDIALSSDPTKSGIETHLTETTLYLYFYVGDIDQNHGIVNMGRIGEQLANKIGRTECKAYITETYQNGTSWYRVYSDGWCEQGGYVSGQDQTISLLKKYKDVNYYINVSPKATDGGYPATCETYFSKVTNTSFYIAHKGTSGGSGSALGYSWETSGYIS